MKITPDEYYKKNRFYPADRLMKDNKILCYKCEQGEAHCSLIGTIYTVGLCNGCQKLQDKRHYDDLKKYGPLTGGPEFIPQSVKDQRGQYFNSMVQPEREGVPSREFVEAYPEKARKLFKERLDKAQYVWKDQSGWNHREKSL